MAFGASLGYGCAPGNVSIAYEVYETVMLTTLLLDLGIEIEKRLHTLRNCRSISSLEPSMICSVTCASCPFFSLTVPFAYFGDFF